MEYIVIEIADSSKEAMELYSKKIEFKPVKKNPKLLELFSKPNLISDLSLSDKSQEGARSKLCTHDYQRIVEMVLAKLNELPMNDSTTTSSDQLNYICVRKHHKIVKIPLENILYIHVEGRYSTIISDLGKFMVEMSLVKLYQKFSKIFIRSHRSYLVNEQKIRSLDLCNYQLNLTNGESVPMSLRHKDSILKQFKLLK